MRNLAIIMAGCAVFIGCGSNDKPAEEADPSSTTTEFATTAPTEAPSTSTSLPAVGELAVSGGITATVNKVSIVQSVKFNDSMYETNSEYAQLIDLTAGDGAKFVVVEVTIRNDSTSSIDLTCGYPIKNILIDDQDRQFDAIEDLYKLPGNPECNDNLQPGFEAAMTWVYKVPVDAVPLGWYMQDVTELGSDLDPAIWRIDS